MTHEHIIRWLQNKTRAASMLHLAGALGLFCLGVVVLFITFWMIYGVVWLGFNWFLPHSHITRMIISFAVLILLFVGNARTNRAYLESYSFTTGTSNPRPMTIYLPGIGVGSTINPLAPDTLHSQVKVFTSLLFSGPRLATAAFRLVGRARRIRSLDLEACAAILAFLSTKDARVSFKEVVKAIPGGVDVPQVLEQLAEIDGVMFLKSDPPGLSLMSGLRTELRELRVE